jgi:alpha-tubulin suppressor-like RCC1 family protein
MILLTTNTGNSISWKIGGVTATVLNPGGTVFTVGSDKKYQLGIVNITGTTMTLNVVEMS